MDISSLESRCRAYGLLVNPEAVHLTSWQGA